MPPPYEYSYFAFDFCLIKKKWRVRKQKMEWAAEGERKGTGGKGTERRREWRGVRARPAAQVWRGWMSDETNRVVQAPTHATTAVIYSGGLENRRASIEWRRDPQKSPLHHPSNDPPPNSGATALIKPCTDGEASVSSGQCVDSRTGGSAPKKGGRLLCEEASASK